MHRERQMRLINDIEIAKYESNDNDKKAGQIPNVRIGDGTLMVNPSSINNNDEKPK